MVTKLNDFINFVWCSITARTMDVYILQLCVNTVINSACLLGYHLYYSVVKYYTVFAFNRFVNEMNRKKILSQLSYINNMN